MEREPASFLPEHIRDVLKRKSSRDTTSRFHTKLHLLLGYVSDTPSYQDLVGLAWTTNDEFKMNKATLANVMGIKLNTLNVNLRDLNFVQIQRDKSGWTYWKRAGFTRTASTIEPEENGAAAKPGRQSTRQLVNGLIGKSPTIPFTLGKVTDDQSELFLASAQKLWFEVLQCSATAQVAIDFAIDRAASRFRYQEQPIENAHDVINAIIRPSLVDAKLGFADFCRFLAMFGPEKTVMLKIAALLTNSNKSGKWLTFEKAKEAVARPSAFFDYAIPNCLVIHHADYSQERVYNIPTTEAATGPYLVDEFGDRYKDWDEWFIRHPVKQQGSVGMLNFP
jgi:hypothetical protein